MRSPKQEALLHEAFQLFKEHREKARANGTCDKCLLRACSNDVCGAVSNEDDFIDYLKFRAIVQEVMETPMIVVLAQPRAAADEQVARLAQESGVKA